MINKKTHIETFFCKRLNVLICLFLVIATLAVYWQVKGYEFVNYDDSRYVYNNGYVQAGLTLKGVIWAFTATHASNWHPLTWLSHMLDCQLFGLNPGWHHLTNVFFHIANTLLLLFVLRRMTGALWRSFFVAALFALHPLHVESVAWVAERKDVLSTFFWLLTMWGYARYVERPGLGRYLLILLFFALGLMAKPMLVTLPFVLLLLDYWPLERFQFGGAETIGDSHGDSQLGSTAHRLVWEKIPLFLLTVVSSVVTFLIQQSSGAAGSLVQYPLVVRIANGLVSYARYIGKMILPSHLAVLYPHPGMLPWWQVAAACLLLVSISLLVIKSAKRRPYFVLGWLWYIGTLVPVIGFVQVGAQAMADRYTYVPLVGLFIMISWGVSELVAELHYGKIGLAAIGVAILSILMGTTWFQVRCWKNSITLFRHSLDVAGESYVVHNNLGNALLSKGRSEEAIAQYRKALRLKPDFMLWYYNWGNALVTQGKLDEAIRRYSEALLIDPDYAEAHNSLGVALLHKGEINEAITHFREALRIRPGNIVVYTNLQVALAKKTKSLKRKYREKR
ncbi:MAG: tetratricopeptide repeat protein [Desulfobacteraceae bacterium]|nr:tetratricopeptide repeat protein [Desulfobacteraceae bacterium]